MSSVTKVRPRRVAAALALGAWFAVSVWGGAALLAKHVVALPAPDDGVAPALAALRDPEARSGWSTFHVLLGSCPCSRRIAEHLLSTTRPADVVEHVVLVGPDAILEPRLRARGFRVVSIAPEQLAEQLHIESAPLLVILGPDARARYVGGYTSRKQGPDVRDLELLSAARRAEPLRSLPVFGCAFSRRLLAALAPASLP